MHSSHVDPAASRTARSIPAAKAKLLEGKKVLIVGIVNDQWIAWSCAREFRAFGAELAVTYLNDVRRSPCSLDQACAAFHEILPSVGTRPGAGKKLIDANGFGCHNLILPRCTKLLQLVHRRIHSAPRGSGGTIKGFI
jgi:hypothetical protein